MQSFSFWPAVLGLALAMALVTVLEPTPNSLAYASAMLGMVALLGWVIEAREVAGPPPVVEPEEPDEESAAGPSFWPVVLAMAIVGVAAGLVYGWEYGALLVATPLAVSAAGAWLAAVKRELAALPSLEPEALGPPIISGGEVLRPVPSSLLAAQAASGAAIAIERVETKQVSRRSLLRLTFWTGMAAGLTAAAAAMLDFLYPRGITGFGGVISAGTVDELSPGSKQVVTAGKFWLVHLSEEQGGPGFLALWWKCPHLGCTVPWRDDFSWPDPATGQNKLGWFRCPCHGSTYTDAGVRVFGPAPRSMDMMELTIEDGRISVNTGSITKGRPDNFRYAIKS